MNPLHHPLFASWDVRAVLPELKNFRTKYFDLVSFGQPARAGEIWELKMDAVYGAWRFG